MNFLLLALILLGGGLSARAAVDDLPCVVCHPSRDRVAYELLSNIPGVRSGQESAQALVCLSCHNGTVRDDRRRLGAGGQHPTGVRGTAATPDILPLYGDRKVECGTCHSPHGDGPAAKRWLRLEVAGNTLCTTCHSNHADRHLGRPLSQRQSAAVTRRGGLLGRGGQVECSTCHVVHGAQGNRLLLAPFGPQEDQLCRVCHDNLGVKGVAASSPSQPCASCHTPHSTEILQLRGGLDGPCVSCHPDRDGDGEHPRATPACAECHSMHSPVLPNGQPAGLLRMFDTGGLLCTPCHPDGLGVHAATVEVSVKVAAQLRNKNLPADGAQASCNTCHRMHRQRDTPLLRMPQTILCLYCHPGENPFGPDGMRAGAHPVAVLLDAQQRSRLEASGGRVGPGGELACNSCHRAHSANPGARLECATCHPRQGAAQRGHAGTGTCGNCHAIHGEHTQTLPCSKCHATPPGPHPAELPLAGTGLPAVDSQGKLALSGTMGCVTCHDPHGNDNPLLRESSATATCLACHPRKAELASGSHAGDAEGGFLCAPCHPPHGETSSPEGPDPASALCRTCHPEERPVSQEHSRRGQPPWSQLTAELPLFDQQGEPNEYGFISCSTCHDVHTDRARRSMRADDRSPPELCLACHQEKVSLLGSAHDPREGGETATCTVCHQIHSGQEQPGIWALQEEGEGTWNDRKCTPCHGGLKDAPWGYTDITSHPVNMLLPQGMGTKGLPLFDALGGTMGRAVACTTCHNLHGTATGPGQTIPNFLRKAPGSGELCTACHGDQSAVVGTVHDVKSDPDPLGPCSPCHVAHGASSPRALWWPEPADGAYEPNRLCRTCHVQGGLAEGDSQLMQHHMKDAEDVRSPRGTIYLQRPMLLLDEQAIKSGVEPVIPLFQRDGEAGPDGNLQCVSCHTPHQWSPMGSFVKPGFGTLGPNVPTKFLLIDDERQLSLSVCASCHPDDALQRYREYHRVWEDVGAEFR